MSPAMGSVMLLALSRSCGISSQPGMMFMWLQVLREFVFITEIQNPNLHIRKLVLDCGALQADALTVDRLASLEKYSQTAVVPRASILATEVEWLNFIKADLVVSDVVPVACRAAADAGIHSVCVTNFSWDFIYAEYVMAAGHHHRSIVWQPAGWKLKQEWLPTGWLCLVCGASDKQELPPDFIKLAKDVYTPDLMAASDCMLGKIGYGTVSEALAYKLPFVFVQRDYFNEEPFLRNMLEVVARILQDTALGKNYAPVKLSGARRLRDAIVLGYELQRSPGRDIGIPDWYSLAENEVGLLPAVPNTEVNGKASLLESCIEDFEILHGGLHGFPDTVTFLKSLSGLDTGADSVKNTEKHQMWERSAAGALFSWEMPIRDACHVAVQRNHPSKQKLWKHAQA